MGMDNGKSSGLQKGMCTCIIDEKLSSCQNGTSYNVALIQTECINEIHVHHDHADSLT